MRRSTSLTLTVVSLLLSLLVSTQLAAESLFMVRVNADFPSAMTELQKAIVDHGYTISRVQRVDIGLTKSGYKTAEYRVVFFGKPAEIKYLSQKYTDLIPYLPLKIVIFAEGEDTLIMTNNPMNLNRFYRKSALKTYFARWERDLRAIFAQIRKADK